MNLNNLKSHVEGNITFSFQKEIRGDIHKILAKLFFCDFNEDSYGITLLERITKSQ